MRKRGGYWILSQTDQAAGVVCITLIVLSLAYFGLVIAGNMYDRHQRQRPAHKSPMKHSSASFFRSTLGAYRISTTPMNGYVANIEEATLENTDFRRVLYTATNSQLVVMSIPPGSDIGEETHHLDQFLRIEQGEGKAILDDVSHDIKDAWAVVVPAGTKHNFINTGKVDLKLYSIYSPPEHKDGTVHATKADAVEEHFDGVTTE